VTHYSLASSSPTHGTLHCWLGFVTHYSCIRSWLTIHSRLHHSLMAPFTCVLSHCWLEFVPHYSCIRSWLIIHIYESRVRTRVSVYVVVEFVSHYSSYIVVEFVTHYSHIRTRVSVYVVAEFVSHYSSYIVTYSSGVRDSLFTYTSHESGHEWVYVYTRTCWWRVTCLRHNQFWKLT